jgi:hypothetical protein
MKHILLLAAFFSAALVLLAGAPHPAPQLDAAARARFFERNRDLIQTLVEGGLRLAVTDDPLERAECCSGVAESLAAAIQQAARKQDGAHVAELGLHLRALLQTGVAANLSTARRQIPLGSMLEKNLREVRDRTAHLVEPLEEQLLHLTDREYQQEIRYTLKALQVGRTEVENALESPMTLRDGTDR